MEDKTSFLSRWSQRKTEQQALADDDHVDSLDKTITPPIPEEEEAAVLTDEDMPDVESLNESSDFSQFFSIGVSDELRNLALQKLFRLPEFNLRDGLNDYDEDFSKMPELTEAVASKLRNWVNEQKEAFEEELTENPAEEATTEERIEQTQEFSTSDEVEDELGDADLDG